jgi:ribosomal protein S18 acetylase RimI-like enzyme
MDVRAARAADKPAIRDVARRSLQASYSLSPKAITTAIQEWYDEIELAETLGEEDRFYLVGEHGGQVVAFSESVLVGDQATLLWLHVDPSYRGEGFAEGLIEETESRLKTAGAERLRGRVLEDNADGNAFYEAQGFEQAGQEEVGIAGRTYTENVWVSTEPGALEPVADGDRTVYVDTEESEKGSVAPFNVVYSDEGRSETYGYFCTNCDRLANAMDAMGRVECDNCGNTRKPARWDAAYL